MNDKSSSPPTGARGWEVMVGIGVILLGVAAVIVAAQWETHTRLTVDTSGIPRSPATEPQKVGFALISVKEEKANEFADPTYVYYLLDKDSGRIWGKNTFNNSWKELDVEGITP